MAPARRAFGLAWSLLAAGAPAWGAKADQPTSPEVVTLAQCLSLADKLNPDLQGSRAQVESRRGSLIVSRAGFFPRLDLESAYRDEQLLNRTSSAFLRTKTRTPASLAASALLFDFGRTNQAYRRAQRELLAAEENLRVARARARLETTLSFVAVLRAQESKGISDATIRRREQLLESTRELFESGLRPRFDVTRAEIDLVTARLDLVEIESRIAREWEGLRAAIGSPDQPEAPLENIFLEPRLTVSEERMLAGALKSRPDLLAAQAQAEAQGHQLGQARRDYLPTADASASLGHRSSNINGLFAGHERLWTMGFSARWNLFGGLARKGAVLRERGLLDKALAEVEAARLRTISEVRETVTALRAEYRKVDLTSGLVRLTEENQELSWELYRSGKGTIIQVTDAQRELLSARQARLASLADYRVALARLERAVGVPLGRTPRR